MTCTGAKAMKMIYVKKKQKEKKKTKLYSCCCIFDKHNKQLHKLTLFHEQHSSDYRIAT